MAVAFDVFSRPGTGTGVTGDQNWTHTPSGTPKGVVVFILYGANSPNTDHVVGVTYGGTAMTEVSGSPNILESTEDMHAYCYILTSSVPTGAQTVSIDTDGNAAAYSAGCITLTTTSNDTESVDVDATINSATATNPSVTLSLGGKTCFAAIGFVSGQNAVTGITPLTSWTAQSEEDTGGQTMGIYTYDTIGSTDVTAGWTQASEEGVAIAIALAEVAGGGGGATHPGWAGAGWW